MATDISGNTFSETDASNNSATPNGWPEGQAPSTVNDCARMMMGAIKRAYDRDHAGSWCTVGGTANAITLAYTTGPTAYVQGEKYAFKATAANTGATTVNVSGLGAKNVYVIANGTPTACTGHEIANGQIVETEYDGTQLQLLNPAPDEGSWTPTLAGDSTAGTQTYSIQVGRYIRRGNLVTAWFSLVMSAKDAATGGNIIIAGFPFQSTNVASLNGGSAITQWGGITLTANYTQLGVALGAATTQALLTQSGSAQGAAAISAAGLSATSSVIGAVTYRIN